MKCYQKYFSACLLALLTQAAFAQVPNLGTAARFALLSATTASGGAVTYTDSTISGNVGSSGLPAAVVNIRSTVSGAITAPVPAQVLADFNAAYVALRAVPCGQTLTGTLAGITLAPGVYCFAAAAELTGTLTLAGNGTWLFKVGTSGIGALTTTDFKVLSAGNGCNVSWWVAQAATMTDSHFKGNILAGSSITHTGTIGTFGPATFSGRALAKTAVTLTDMTVAGCP